MTHTNSPTSTTPAKRKREEEEEENRQTPQDTTQDTLHKTSLCKYFRRQSASCSHGDACRYAHSEAELRKRPDGSWDPTSDRAKNEAEVGEVGENGEKGSKEDEVMITEMMGGEEEGEESGVGLSKCLVHLPRKWLADQLKKFLDDQGVPFKSAKKKKGMTVGFVTFESAEQSKLAVEKLQGKAAGNKTLKVADCIPRSFEKNVKSAMALHQNAEDGLLAASSTENAALEPSDGTVTSNLDGDGPVSRAKSARDVVTPLAHMPYGDQLEHKKKSLEQILKKLTRNARKACPNGVSLPEWILESREIGGLPCRLEGVLPSPLVNGYRNKCEFSVGLSLQGKPTAGFTLGNFREGVTAVQEPTDCPNVSVIACKFAMIFQEFLQNSDLPLWNRFKNSGFWRQLTVREGRAPRKIGDDETSDVDISEVLLMVQVCSVGFDDKLLTSEYERLAQAFSAGAITSSPPLPLTAFVIQDHQGISNVAPADAPLLSIPIRKAENASELLASGSVEEVRIHDHINNLRFCISPTAFFQVNTLAAEKLYSLAGEWAGLGPDTLLFDICCGTGTIGLTLANRVGMVVGIEMNASAVSDAYRNADVNGIKNCRFICGKAEDVLASLLKEYLNEPQQNEIVNTSETSKKEDTDVEMKSASAANTIDSESSPSHKAENCGKETTNGGEKHTVDALPESEVSPNYKTDNHEDASVHSESRGQELKDGFEKSSTSEYGVSSVQQFKNIVAIVDPPRGGLHPTVTKALRTHHPLRRLVYISCNPETLVANAIELCTPSPESNEKVNKGNRGWRGMSSAGLARHRVKSMPNSEPFHPVKAMAVDLFPHTSHCEMVMLLER